MFRPLPVVLAALAFSISAYPALDKPVRLDTGFVAGITTGTVSAFKGIPYAAPPVGNLRWREPQPAAAWNGVRQAGHFSAACYQRISGAFGPWSAEYIAPDAMGGGSNKSPQREGSVVRGAGSEDCLYLNVWTAALKSGEKRPVIVWLYGGGFTSGSGDVPIYDGAGLASRGVVMLTVNYRLGVFGFLAHPDLKPSGNYALLDMIAALQWVHRNIAAFGGDPADVTIAGQSAGAFAVTALMASPLAKGLFHRAIAESGAATSMAMSLKDAQAAATKLAESLGAKDLAQLRAIPPDVLLNAQFRAGIAIDGYVLPTDVRTIFEQGHQNDVPFLTGWNADDGVSFGPAPTAGAFRAHAQHDYGDLAADFLKAYPASTDAEAAVSQHALNRDQAFASPQRLLAGLHTKTGKSNVFLYFFDRVAPGTEAQTKYGAFHSGEIAYALDTLAKWDRPWTATDRRLEDQMSSYWINFAKTGDPNGRGLLNWPAYTAADERSLRLGETIAVIPIPGKPGLDFFDEWSSKRR